MDDITEGINELLNEGADVEIDAINQRFIELNNKIDTVNQDHDEKNKKIKNALKNQSDRSNKLADLIENNKKAIKKIAVLNNELDKEKRITIQLEERIKKIEQLLLVESSDSKLSLERNKEVINCESDIPGTDKPIKKKRKRQRGRRKVKNEQQNPSENQSENSISSTISNKDKNTINRNTGKKNDSLQNKGEEKTVVVNEKICKEKEIKKDQNYASIKNIVETARSARNSDAESDSYFEKAHQYLLTLQTQHKILSQENENNATVLLTTQTEDNVYPFKLKDRLLVTSMEWLIRRRKPTATEIIYHSGTFYTGNPGYRVQLRAQIDRLHGDVYFSVRILQGLFDQHLTWPFQCKFCIKLSPKMKCMNVEDWLIPPTPYWKKSMGMPLTKGDDIFSEWCGPFNISMFVESNTLTFDFSLSK